MCVSLCEDTHVIVGIYTVQKRVLDPLRLELQTLMSHQPLELGTEPESLARTVYTLNH